MGGQPGGRSTDAADMPPGGKGYATRTVDRIVAQAACYGESTGIYARRLLDGDAPWMMMRSVYRLIGLAKRYGAEAAEAACARALDVDVINVSKIESMLKNATEKTPAAAARRGGRPAAAGSPVTRPSTPPRPGCGCGSCRRQRPRRGSAALTCPAASDCRHAPPGAACARGTHPFPGFFSFLFFSRAEKKKKGLCHD